MLGITLDTHQTGPSGQQNKEPGPAVPYDKVKGLGI
jgi:hypothetical protein